MRIRHFLTPCIFYLFFGVVKGFVCCLRPYWRPGSRILILRSWLQFPSYTNGLCTRFFCHIFKWRKTLIPFNTLVLLPYLNLVSGVTHGNQERIGNTKCIRSPKICYRRKFDSHCETNACSSTMVLVVHDTYDTGNSSIEKSDVCDCWELLLPISILT